MAQQDTDQQHAGVLPVDDEGYVVDTEDCEEREGAWRERGTSRPITVVGNPVLHKECRDVTEFGEELQQLVADMFASQRTAEGVGLAANQIGVDLKVFVYDCQDDEGDLVVDQLQPGELRVDLLQRHAQRAVEGVDRAV
ncbi:peptide deformylase, partial [Streptomyces sp. NPDC051132]|uniref:peptide deformylase n=1 Tax=Streptomyces sp. NPDC051132 TaxID=3155667 RepID=UPI003444D247